jgi:hypothetical protein
LVFWAEMLSQGQFAMAAAMKNLRQMILNLCMDASLPIKQAYHHGCCNLFLLGDGD